MARSSFPTLQIEIGRAVLIEAVRLLQRIFVIYFKLFNQLM